MFLHRQTIIRRTVSASNSSLPHSSPKKKEWTLICQLGRRNWACIAQPLPLWDKPTTQNTCSFSALNHTINQMAKAVSVITHIASNQWVSLLNWRSLYESDCCCTVKTFSSPYLFVLKLTFWSLSARVLGSELNGAKKRFAPNSTTHTHTHTHTNTHTLTGCGERIRTSLKLWFNHLRSVLSRWVACFNTKFKLFLWNVGHFLILLHKLHLLVLQP